MPAGLRKDQPSRFLDASLVSLENALLTRAQAIATEVLTAPGLPAGASDNEVFQDGLRSAIRSLIAEEFRVLAEELHHW